MRYGRQHRDEISVKGLIKRNKEIKRRRYPWRIIHIDSIHRKKDGSRAAVTAYRTRDISRFLVATSARREPEVGAHSSFPAARPGVRARTAD